MIVLVPLSDSLWANPALISHGWVDSISHYEEGPSTFFAVLTLTTGEVLNLGAADGYETRAAAVAALNAILSRTLTISEELNGGDFGRLWRTVEPDPYVEALGDAYFQGPGTTVRSARDGALLDAYAVDGRVDLADLWVEGVPDWERILREYLDGNLRIDVDRTQLVRNVTIRDPDVTPSDDPQAEDKPGDNRTDLNNGKDPE